MPLGFSDPVIIISTPVVSETGQELGHIDELVMDVRNGDVRHMLPWAANAFRSRKTGGYSLELARTA